MNKEASKFTIKDKELASELDIDLERLYKIVDFFDSDSTDKWELRENEHFIYLSRTRGTRLFSQLGAFAIAKYIDATEQKSLWNRIVEFVTRREEKVRLAFVKQKIRENCGSLALRNHRHFLSKQDALNILCTSSARLNQAFKELQAKSLMEQYKHFDDFNGERYYSLSGLDRLNRELADKLTKQDRREWCSAVHAVVNKTLNQIISAEAQREKRISAAMDAAKRRDKCCKITGEKPKPSNQVELAAHHIFSKKHYPHLAESADNLITLTAEVHKEFHAWNGGSDKPCTIDNLIRFVNEMYPEYEEVSEKLNNLKKILRG